MLKWLFSQLRSETAGSPETVTNILKSFVYPAVLKERLEPDGHDLITVLTVYPSTEDTALNCLQTVLSQPGYPVNNPNPPDFNGQTPVFYAARDGRLSLLKFLTEKLKYPIDTVDRFGQTAAFYAAREGRVDVLKYIHGNSERGLTVRDKNGQSPIFYACEKNQVAAVKWLVEEGAVDPEARDNMRRCARNYATSSEIIKFLSKKQGSKKRKIEQVPLWVNLTKDVLRTSGVSTKFPEIANLKKNLENGDFPNFKAFYDRIEHALKSNNPDLHDHFLQLAMATGLAN